MAYWMGEKGKCIHCEKSLCDCKERTRLFFIEGDDFQNKKQEAREIAGPNNELAFELIVAALLGYKVTAWELNYLKHDIELDRKAFQNKLY
ncbi:MAG: hypothetical protein ABL876_07990 [Chitinophagaceae bacterium]